MKQYKKTLKSELEFIEDVKNSDVLKKHINPNMKRQKPRLKIRKKYYEMGVR